MLRGDKNEKSHSGALDWVPTRLVPLPAAIPYIYTHLQTHTHAYVYIYEYIYTWLTARGRPHFAIPFRYPIIAKSDGKVAETP